MGGARRRNKRRFPEEFPGRNVCCQDDFLDAMDIQGQGRLGGCSGDARGMLEGCSIRRDTGRGGTMQQRCNSNDYSRVNCISAGVGRVSSRIDAP